MDPRVIAEYDQFYGNLLASGRIPSEWGYRARLNIFLGFARQVWAYDVVGPLCTGKRVLDIGCYTGYGETRICERAAEIVAIDINQWAIENARCTHHLLGVRFELADATDLPFQDGLFDVVLAMQLFEHLEPSQVAGFLSGVNRVLVNGGLFVLATPNKKIRFPLGKKPFNPEHMREYTASELDSELRAAFDEVTILGVRASEWIETVELKRVRSLARLSHMGQPIANILRSCLKQDTMDRLKERLFWKHLSPPRDEQEARMRDLRFSEMLAKTSMQEFFLVRDRDSVDKSLDILAFALKGQHADRSTDIDGFLERVTG